MLVNLTPVVFIRRGALMRLFSAAKVPLIITQSMFWLKSLDSQLCNFIFGGMAMKKQEI